MNILLSISGFIGMLIFGIIGMFIDLRRGGECHCGWYMYGFVSGMITAWLITLGVFI